MKRWSSKNGHATGRRILSVSALVVAVLCSAPQVWASQEDSVVPQGQQTQQPTEVNNMIAKDSGVAVNGDSNGSNINNNQNTLTNGSNTNLNLISPNVVTPTQAAGGNSVLMLPRNPLPMPNAALGRSNFGLQFGVQNNPILGGFNSLSGKQNALGWFMQAGLTIPFGKIPNMLNNSQTAALDDLRQRDIDRRRNVFGNMSPGGEANPGYRTRVNGKISGLSAYNFTTLPTAQLSLPQSVESKASIDTPVSPPKLLALSTAEVFSKPLNTGEKIGSIEVGLEYPYLGHTHSGWVKVILPNGAEGWTSTRFEYIKHDYTEIDSLALVPQAGPGKQVAQAKHDVKSTSMPSTKSSSVTKTEKTSLLPTADKILSAQGDKEPSKEN